MCFGELASTPVFQGIIADITCIYLQAFAEYSLQAAIDNESQFYSSWKEYRVNHPTFHRTTDAAAGGSVDLDKMMGDDDDAVPLFGGAPDAPAVPAAAAAPAAVAAPAAAAAPAEGNTDSD